MCLARARAQSPLARIFKRRIQTLGALALSEAKSPSWVSMIAGSLGFNWRSWDLTRSVCRTKVVPLKSMKS